MRYVEIVVVVSSCFYSQYPRGKSELVAKFSTMVHIGPFYSNGKCLVEIIWGEDT